MALEDRYVDALIDEELLDGHTVLIAQTARVWIDLNRSEQDIDPGMLAFDVRLPGHVSAKARGGLGLVPRRTPALGEIWRQRIAREDLEARIATHHRPYHAALAAMIANCTDAFGGAILIDLHSMPPLAPANGRPAPQIVIGDRFGRSSASWVGDRIREIVAERGLVTASNAPYAGGHILDRHGAPQRNVHAVQIEIDRTLYLDPATLAPATAITSIRAMFAEVIQQLADDFSSRALPLAAE